MKAKEHQEFAKYVARTARDDELTRRGKEWNPLWDILIEWIGNNVGTLPDYLEPATDPSHRGILHSADAFRKIEEWKETIRREESQNWWFDVLLIMALSSYQSHIALDSTTTKGVPDYQWVWALLRSFGSATGH